MSQGDLSNRHVLVTRPAAEAGVLLQRLQELGARPLAFPALVIEPLWAPGLPALLERTLGVDFVVFVSPSAVRTYFSALDRLNPGNWTGSARARESLNGGARAVAIGPGTVSALKRQGVESPLAPAAQFDSDGVAALPELTDVAGRSVAIVCGTGGRRSLGEALSARGAAVTHVECYQRVPPDVDITPLIALWAGEGIDAALLTSSEAVRSLWDLLGQTGQGLWCDTPTFVPHERIKATGVGLGLRRVVVTAPGDEAMVNALVQFFR